jgi:hypothetical protein
VDSGYATDLGGRDPERKFTPFLGYEEARPEILEQYAKIGIRGLADLSAVVLATDGLSEPGIGVADPARAVHATASRIALDAPADRRAVDTCRGITEVAMQSHRDQKAGDNMGCAVVWIDRP